MFSGFELSTRNIEKICNLDELKRNSEIRELSRCPIEGHNGHWEGERGDSKWIPDKEYIPPCSNIEGKTWGEILDNNGIDGIEYKDGEPDFSPIAKETVEIDDFTGNRAKNFDQADEKLAEKLNCYPEDVEKMRKENNETWHECPDCKTMKLVPSEIHNNIPHTGGISEYNSKNEVKK